jgi:hypothetical protein
VAEGTLSWAYTASGDLRWLGPISARVVAIAEMIGVPAGGTASGEWSVAASAFLLGWAGELAPRWAAEYGQTVLSFGVSPT